MAGLIKILFNYQVTLVAKFSRVPIVFEQFCFVVFLQLPSWPLNILILSIIIVIHTSFSLYIAHLLLLNPLPCTIEWQRLEKLSCLSASIISSNNNTNKQRSVRQMRNNFALWAASDFSPNFVCIVFSQCLLQTGLGGINFAFGYCPCPYYYLCT